MPVAQMNKSNSTSALPCTKDFSNSETYLQHYVKPYVADRFENYEFYPLHQPDKDNLEFKWRQVNKEPFLLKKYGRFPRPLKELQLEDIRNKLQVARTGIVDKNKDTTNASAINKGATSCPSSNAVLSQSGGPISTTSGFQQDTTQMPHQLQDGEIISPRSLRMLGTRETERAARAAENGNVSPKTQESQKKQSNYENQKPAKEIFHEKGKLGHFDEFDNFELAQMKLKEDTLYVPPGSKYQAPHPLSGTRNTFQDDATINMKKVLALRRKGGAVIPTSQSLTDIPLAPNRNKAVEFGSVKQLHKCRNKHMRPLNPPFEKFGGTMTLGSQAIGWAQDNPNFKNRYRGPTHGITDSAVTQYYHNMKATNMEAILRYEG